MCYVKSSKSDRSDPVSKISAQVPHENLCNVVSQLSHLMWHLSGTYKYVISRTPFYLCYVCATYFNGRAIYFKGILCAVLDF